MITACYRPYITLLISIYTYLSPKMLFSMLYILRVYGEKYLEWLRMYSGLFINVWRVGSLKSHGNKWAALSESAMIMFRNIFDSRRDFVGDAVSSYKSSLYPPTFSRTCKGSGFKGLWSQIKLVYVTFWLSGTLSFLMKLILFVTQTWTLTPFTRHPSSIISDFLHVPLFPPPSKLSIVFLLLCLL